MGNKETGPVYGLAELSVVLDFVRSLVERHGWVAAVKKMAATDPDRAMVRAALRQAQHLVDKERACGNPGEAERWIETTDAVHALGMHLDSIQGEPVEIITARSGVRAVLFADVNGAYSYELQRHETAHHVAGSNYLDQWLPIGTVAMRERLNLTAGYEGIKDRGEALTRAGNALAALITYDAEHG